jgi:quinol monooxygenase YgiN
MLDIVVTQRVHPGAEADFEDVIRTIQKITVAAGAGCLRYEWFRSSVPQTYIRVERWVDEAAMQAHLQSEHLAALMPRYRACVPEAFSINRLTPIQAPQEEPPLSRD